MHHLVSGLTMRDGIVLHSIEAFMVQTGTNVPLHSLRLTMREGIMLHFLNAFMVQTGTNIPLHSLHGVTYHKAHVFILSDAVK
jgi:CRISPR/Cas system-associated endonuclease Cas1